MRLFLKRGQADYRTVERVVVTDYHGEEICSCDQSPASLLLPAKKLAIAAGREAGSYCDAEWLAIFMSAGSLFHSGELAMGNRSIDAPAYDRLVCRASGLPLTAVRKARKSISYMLGDIGPILAAQSPDATVSPYRRHRVETSAAAFAWLPRMEALAVIPPSNHPAVHCLWLLALAARIPVLLCPSEEEPFTSLRLAESLYASGLPDGMLQVLPGCHGFKAELLQRLRWGLIFGSDDVLARFTSPTIKGYGPGRSKIVIGGNETDNRREFGLVVRSMMTDGGRGCINVSALLTMTDSRRWAERLGEAVADIPACEPLDEDCQVGVIKNLSMAYGMNGAVEAAEGRGAVDLARRFRGTARLVPVGKGAALLPAVLAMRVDDPLFGAEFLFPFLAVAEVSEAELLKALKKTLTVTTIGLPKELTRTILHHPDVGKVYDGERYATTDINLREPHEGFLMDFLFEKKAARFKE